MQEEVGREWEVGGGGGRGGRAINTVRISATAAWYHHYTCWHCCDRHRRQSGDHELQAFSCTTLKYTEQYRNSLFIRTSISLNYLGENQVKALTPVIFRRQITAPKFAPTTCRIKIKNLGTTVFFQIFFYGIGFQYGCSIPVHSLISVSSGGKCQKQSLESTLCVKWSHRNVESRKGDSDLWWYFNLETLTFDGILT